MIPRSLNWLCSFDSMVISQNIVIVNFLFILVTFQSGIMAFLTSTHCCPEAHWSMQTKQRENLWTAIPAVNSSRRFNKIVNICVSRNGGRINTTEPNEMILVSFFSEDNVLSDESKYAIFFEYQSNENREAFRFWGDTRYIHVYTLSKKKEIKIFFKFRYSIHVYDCNTIQTIIYQIKGM